MASNSSLSPNIGKLKGGDESNSSEIDSTYKSVRPPELSSNASPRRIVPSEDKSKRFNLANQGKGRSKAGGKGKPQRLRKSARPDNVLLGHNSKERKLWLFVVTALTGYIPNFVLRLFGMHGQDVIQAWREKFALCMIVIIISALAIAWLEISSNILCPQVPNAFTWSTIEQSKYLVVANGKVLDVTRSNSNMAKILAKYVGKDVSGMIPSYSRLGHPSLDSNSYVDTQINACIADPQVADRWLTARINSDWSRTLSLASDGRLSGCPKPGGPFGSTEACFYSDAAWREFNRLVVGDLLLDRNKLSRMFNETDRPNYAIILSKAYDLTQYVRHSVIFNTDSPDTAKFDTVEIFPRPRTMFLPLNVTLPLVRAAGTDISQFFSQSTSQTYISCLDKLFYAGRITPEIFETICGVGNPIIVVATGLVYSIVVIKFLVSIIFQLGPRPAQMNAYILCFVPCYTEGSSMRITLETLAESDYDDSKKLIVVVCDGNIKGKGNPKPTPQMVLDMVGWQGEEPEPKLVHALGKGSDKINMCKAYCGLYQHKHHRVPYIVIAKVGKPDEAKKPKPGNRGKRDSQLILMNYFNKVVHNREMSPFEYELYYLMKYCVGVDPKLYEYCLMVDADTQIEKDSMNELVAAMVNDHRKIAVCGETQVLNKWASWVTAIQVHEYYINHHLGKAFESMFGSVTCLPGCFSMYRYAISSVSNQKGDAFLVNDLIIEDYKINKVSTLHSKNLLHLGEDRYLTTLLLKHFPGRRLEFIPSAVCHTDIPDSFSVLLSQRRRWINSTFHNLYEVMKLPRLCSFCFISMKTLVFMDLLSTLILPVSTLYLYSLIIRAFIEGIEKYTFVLIGAAGLYFTHLFIILFIRKQYEYVIWITIYIILSMPIFSIVLPLYAFWHFDDFSWGATRLIEGGDDGHIDGDASGQIKNIECKKMFDYEQADPRLRNQGMMMMIQNQNQQSYPGMMSGGHMMGPVMYIPQPPNGQYPMGGGNQAPMMRSQAPHGGYMMYQPMAMQSDSSGQPHTSLIRSPPQAIDLSENSNMSIIQSLGSSTLHRRNPAPIAPNTPPLSTVPLPNIQQPDSVESLQQMNYPKQISNQSRAPIGGTVGQAFDQLFRDLQGQEENDLPPPPVPSKETKPSYQNSSPPMTHKAFNYPTQEPAPNRTFVGGTVGHEFDQLFRELQIQEGENTSTTSPPVGNQHSSQQRNTNQANYPNQVLHSAGAKPGIVAGGTVGNAFAEAFKTLQDL